MGRNYGMQFSVNNVGSELNDLKSIEWLLPEVDILKASMRSFRKEDPHEWLDLNLQFWNRLARENHIKLVLVGIENATDQALAEQLQIDARQGYLFGKPEDVHRGAEKWKIKATIIYRPVFWKRALGAEDSANFSRPFGMDWGNRSSNHHGNCLMGTIWSTDSPSMGLSRRDFWD